MKYLLSVALPLVVSSMLGCSTPTASETLCDRAFEDDCTYPGGYDGCVDSFQSIEDRATKAGCGAEVDELYDCMGTKSDSCSPDIEATCPKEAAALDACDKANR